MPERDESYIRMLDDSARRVLSFKSEKGKVLRFCVILEVLIDDVWTEAMKIDTHNNFPHRHLYNTEGKKVKTYFPCKNFKDGLNLAVSYITDDFKNLRDNYLTQAAKKRNN